jgi:hypothetical protein
MYGIFKYAGIMAEELSQEELTEELKQTGNKYRKELLMMPVAKISDTVKHMTFRTGVRGKETIGKVTTDPELGPYKTYRKASTPDDPTLRELETFLGDVVEEFDPIKMSRTVFGGSLSQDKKEMPISKAIAMSETAKIGEKLAKSIFTAKRNSAGDKTKDLFNGFVTIGDKEVTDGNISSAKGNFCDLPILTEDNVVDYLMQMYLDSASEELQDQKTKMFLPKTIYNLYNKGYQNDFGSSPFNKQYKKTFLEGTEDTCELVPLIGLRKTNRIILSTKKNMLVGVDQKSQMEKVRIREVDNPKLLQLFMMMYFGTEFESIDPEMLCYGKIATS